MLSWVDFVTYILSSIGFWFGFSPLVTLLANKNKKSVSPSMAESNVPILAQFAELLAAIELLKQTDQNTNITLDSITTKLDSLTNQLDQLQTLVNRSKEQ